jgi:hypothetical protein
MIVTFTHRGLLEKAFCLTARGLRDIGDARLTKATVGVSVVIIIRLTYQGVTASALVSVEGAALG